MTPSEIEEIITTAIPHNSTGCPPPSDADWQSLELKFNCKFSADFKTFTSLATTSYCRPGEILEVSAVNGHDSIPLCYDMERQFGHWQPEMIPFFAIGNGDYYCLCASECPESRVYYYSLDRRKFEVAFDSLEGWLATLPELYD